MNTISAAAIRQIAFIIIVILIGGLIFWQLKNFIPAFLGAYTLYILLRKWMFALTKKLRGWVSSAALLLMLASFLLFLVPVYGLIAILVARILPALQNASKLRASAESLVRDLEIRCGFAISTPQNLSNLSDWSVGEAQQITGATVSGFITVIVMYFILYFMLINAKTLEKNLYKWLPLKNQSASHLKKKLNDLVISNAIGIPLSSLIQGLFGLVGYWIAGVEEPYLWFVVTCVVAVIPILGSGLVYIPLSLLLMTQGMVKQGIFLMLYGMAIIGTVDNVFRFWFQKRIGNTHPLVTIFGVIIGLKLFGFIGLIFGPILIAIFLLLLNIYVKEFREEKAVVAVG
jgi:predicted PurR-regulated permease PerM